MAQTSMVHVVGRGEGKRVMEPNLPTTFKAVAAQTGGGFSLVEHIVPPKSLGAPPHAHRNEDEYSYILEGELGVEVGEETVLLTPGDFIVKPRRIMHAFWNAGDAPARLLEIISPAGFEGYFAELDRCIQPDGTWDMAGIMAVAATYELTFDLGRIPELMQRHGLRG